MHVYMCVNINVCVSAYTGKKYYSLLQDKSANKIILN